MAPVTQLGLVALTAVSLVSAHQNVARHGQHRVRHAHLRQLYNRQADGDVTTTSTTTITSTLTETITLDDASATDLAVAAAANGGSAPTCGGIVYVTVTEGAASTSTSSSTSSSTLSSTTSAAAVAVATSTTSAPAPADTGAAAVPDKHAAPPSSIVVPPASVQSQPTPATTAAYSPPAAPASSASSSPAPSASAPATAAPAGSLSTKRGCLYDTGNGCAAMVGNTVSWATNWASNPAGGSTGHVYVPQMWGAKMAATWQEDATTAIAAGAPAVLGYNEPNRADQANLAAADAAARWSEVSQFSGKVTVVSPSVTSDTQDMITWAGIEWLKSFKSAIPAGSPTWDATGVHFYGNCASGSVESQLPYLKGMVDAAVSAFGKPVWVTEFGCYPGTPADQIAAFVAIAIPYLENESNVHQYAMYKADQFVSGGSLNVAGNAYVDATANA